MISVTEDVQSLSLPDVVNTSTSRIQCRDRRAIRREVRQLKKAMRRVLPVEETLKQSLKRRLVELKDDLSTWHLDRLYPRIDLGFLQRQRASRLAENCLEPAFAVFDVASPQCSSRVIGTKRWDGIQFVTVSSPPLMPEPHESLLKAQVRNLLAGSNLASRAEASIQGNFSGAIPMEVRSVIRRSRHIFDELYLITEAPEWRLNASALLPEGDPLLVGSLRGRFYLLKAFDTTPVESYAAREFTSGLLSGLPVQPFGLIKLAVLKGLRRIGRLCQGIWSCFVAKLPDLAVAFCVLVLLFFVFGLCFGARVGG